MRYVSAEENVFRKEFLKITSFFKGNILFDEPMSNYTWYQIGGPADLFLVPQDIDDLIRVSKFSDEKEIPLFPIGNGSNILVSDEGLRGIVLDVKPSFSKLNIDGRLVTVEAGYNLPKLSLQCEKAGLAGFESFVGIPGTVGGALRMNAGAHGSEISDLLIEVKCIRKNEKLILKKDNIIFEYRNSPTLENTLIYQAKFELNEDNIDDIERRRRYFLEVRKQTQPVSLATAGCVFKNPEGLEAAYLIDQSDCKGLKIGGAMISEKHANFIINIGNAKAIDVLNLIEKVREKVHNRFNVELNLENELIGFNL